MLVEMRISFLNFEFGLCQRERPYDAQQPGLDAMPNFKLVKLRGRGAVWICHADGPLLAIQIPMLFIS